MAYGTIGSINGFGSQPVEMAGKIIGQRAGAWHFHDGVRPRWLPKEHVRYRPIGGGYCVMTMPSWLAKRISFRPRKLAQYIKPKTEQQAEKLRIARRRNEQTTPHAV